MAFILHIETALENASVLLLNERQIIASEISTEQKNHASFLFVAIQQVLDKASLSLQNIDAISVSNGPGSYTGLRVGLSAAKGLCYSLQKPLILLSTLELMAVQQISNIDQNEEVLFCPMIDARRMEVYCGIFNNKLDPILPLQACILDENSFSDILEKNKIIFFGSGSNKFQKLTKSNHSIFSDFNNSMNGLVNYISKAYQNQAFSNISYCEPFYLKEVYTTQKSL
jgi:tRNA threonylcarbamoyladenosine biosynthesis protein TsaB